MTVPIYSAEFYGAGASDGLMDGVDLEEHGNGGFSDADVRVAAIVILGSLALLWLFGAGVFVSVNR